MARISLPLLAGLLFLATPSQAVLLVANTGANAIQQFDEATGKYLGVFGQADALTAGIDRPTGLAVGPDDIVYLANGGNVATGGAYQILRFGKDGRFLGIFGQASEAGSGLQTPGDLAFDSEGNLFVIGRKADTGNPKHVLKYDAAGNFQGVFASGIGGSYGYNGLAIDAADNVFVSANGNPFTSGDDHILKFLPDGTPQGIFGEANDVDSLKTPLAMTFDAAGNLHVVAFPVAAVASGGNGEVLKYDAAGSYLGTVGDAASTVLGPGVNGAGLRFDGTGRLFVSSGGNKQVVHFGSDGTWQAAYGEARSAVMGMNFLPEGLAFLDTAPPPEFDIQNAVVIRFFAAEGVSYAIEGTTDMDVWTPAVSGIAGQGRVEKVFVETGNTRRFFRLVTE